MEWDKRRRHEACRIGDRKLLNEGEEMNLDY